MDRHNHPGISQNRPAILRELTMSAQTTAILAQIAQMEASLAQMRSILAATGDVPAAPMTPVKAIKGASRTPGAPVKGRSTPLTEADMEAMVKAGIKGSAHVGSLGKTLFSVMGMPEHSWEDAREQWKEYRKSIDDVAAEVSAAETILSDEVLEALKATGNYNAKSQTRKMAAEFTDYDIHPALHDKAGKEWREYAEKEGLGERSKAPARVPKAPKEAKEALPAVLSADMLESLKESGFHGGSQKRKMADALTALGIAEGDQDRASKEWREWAKEQGLKKPEAAPKKAKKGSESESESESAPATPPAAPAAPAASESAPASIRAPVLDDSRIAQLVSYKTTAETPKEAIFPWFTMWGVPKDKYADALTQWREWAKKNMVKSEDEDEEEDEIELDLE